MTKSVKTATPKRRGRPAKVAEAKAPAIVVATKRRGRPAKAVEAKAPTEVVIVKRRGRPAKIAETKTPKLVVKSSESKYTTGAPGTYKGLQLLIPSMATPAIETWDFEYPGSKTDLSIEIPEFTCVCPKTGLPDFATIIIDYCPNKFCIELKSLKEYVLFYRNLGIFHEHVVNRMLQDIAKACKPKSMSITGVFNSRGGIQTTVQATL
jgi:7-cyano-7-deazaguanine reductase